MDRVIETSLPLAEVAKRWGRESSAVYTDEEIVSLLVKAVWRGDLVAAPPAGHVARDGDYRHTLLGVVERTRTHPGLLFVRPGEPVEPAVTDLPDGGAFVDLRERIEWVAEGEQPDQATAAAAFATFASVDLDAYDQATVVPILRNLTIGREALRQFCEATGLRLPSFWFGGTATASKASAEHQCRLWLADLARRRDKPAGKAALGLEAQKLFSGLSSAAFDRAWAAAAPVEWKVAGAPIKSKRRDNP